MAERENKLLKNSAILMAGSILIKGINFIVAPLLTRWMSADGFGAYDLLDTYVMLLIPLLAAGTHHGVFRFLLEDSSKKTATRIVSNSLAVNAAGLLLYLAASVGIYFLLPATRPYLPLLTLLLIAHTAQNYVCMYLRGLKKIKEYTVTLVIGSCSIMTFLVVFVKLLQLDLTGMVIAYALGYGVSVLAGLSFARGAAGVSLKALDKVYTKELLSYSIHMVPQSISWWIVSISNRVVVSSVLGVASNAILAAANKIPNLCASVYDVVQTAWMENAAEAIHDDDWGEYFSRTFNVMAKICAAISVMLINTNFFLFGWLFPASYEEGRLLVPVLAVAVCFNAMSQCLGTVFMAEFDSKSQSVTMLQAGAVNVLVNLLLIRPLGLLSAAVAALASYVYLFLIRYRKVSRKYRISIDHQTVLMAALMAAVLAVSYLRILALDLAVLVISTALVFVLNREMIGLVLSKVLKKLRSRRG